MTWVNEHAIEAHRHHVYVLMYKATIPGIDMREGFNKKPLVSLLGVEHILPEVRNILLKRLMGLTLYTNPISFLCTKSCALQNKVWEGSFCLPDTDPPELTGSGPEVWLLFTVTKQVNNLYRHMKYRDERFCGDLEGGRACGMGRERLGKFGQGVTLNTFGTSVFEFVYFQGFWMKRKQNSRVL